MTPAEASTLSTAESPEHGRFRPKPLNLFQQMWRLRTAYLFLAPLLILLFLFEYWPFASALYRSTFFWDGFGISTFVGLDNYIRILSDPIFWKSVRVVAIMIAFNITFPMTGSILSAELIFNLSGSRMRYLWRVVFILPSIVPGLVTILLWGFIYNPYNGFLNTVLKAVGLPTQTWLADPRLALPSLLFIGFPWVGGVWMLIFLAGLVNIPGELIDASVVDGCGTLRRVFAIDLPLILGQIKLSIILHTIGTIQGFVNVLVLTEGGPFFATIVPGLYLFQQAFGRQRLGYASAVGVILFLVILALTYLNNRYVRSSVEYEAG